MKRVQPNRLSLTKALVKPRRLLRMYSATFSTPGCSLTEETVADRLFFQLKLVAGSDHRSIRRKMVFLEAHSICSSLVLPEVKENIITYESSQDVERASKRGVETHLQNREV